MTSQLKTLFFAAALTTGAFASSAHAFGEHYLCYNIDPHGAFKEIPVKLKDQFAGYKGLVIRPVSLCNPVDKNGEGIREPEVHLVCYEIKAEPVTKTKPAIDVMTSNQFREQSMTAVLPPHTLCVPSKKEHL